MATVACTPRAFTSSRVPPRRCVALHAISTRRPGCPGPAHVARTLVDLTSTGTLSTLLPGGAPLGTAVSYVLDGMGQPILRLRHDAMHTHNLDTNPVASLFVQPREAPANRVGRLTLLGQACPAQGDLLEAAAKAHACLAAGAVGVDAPAATDRFMVLRVEDCFLVDHLGGGSAAEQLTGQEYCDGTPDALRLCAADLVRFMNGIRADDLLNIGADQLRRKTEDLAMAELLWVDSAGFYLAVEAIDAPERQILRVPFPRPVLEERDARSAFTMMAQEAWERQRPYTPIQLSRLSPSS